MMKWRMTSILALGLLALPAAATAQDRMAAEQVSVDAIRAEIVALGTEFEAASNADDAAALAQFYTADAVLMPPGAPAIEGPDAIREFFGTGMGGATLDLETWDVVAQGSDIVLETGGYEVTGAEGEHLDHGKYIVVWARTDDGWKMKYDMWNSSMAPPEMSHEEMHEKMHGDKTHDEVHEAREDAAHEAAHVIQQKAGAEATMDAADTDDDGDAVPTAEEDDEM